MQIIIPMSGFGERFRKAGYDIPKPLIEIEGKPIIAHVIEMFDGEQDFFFVCNNDHLKESRYNMRSILNKYCPTGKVIGINPHKLGPIHAVLQINNLIDLTKEVIVNYCDFTCYWDWSDFKKFVKLSNCNGVIPAYKGFHPHSLGKTNYAYMLEKNGVVNGIQEKQPYTDNKMNEFASSGTYYFNTAKLMFDSFNYVVDNDINLNGEYYVSLAYNYLLTKNLITYVYPLQHFMQWGTPEDVREYNYWSILFKNLIYKESVKNNYISGNLVIPMAGLGERFSKDGYVIPKPLIPVSGKIMSVQAINDLPNHINKSLILRSDMLGYDKLDKILKKEFPDSIVTSIKKLTNGQACTAKIGVDALVNKHTTIDGPLTFGTCDNGVIFDSVGFQKLLNDKDCDVIVWSIKGYYNAIKYPQMYGWIEEINGSIKNVSVKKPIFPLETTPIVIGTFTFKNSLDFDECYQSLLLNNNIVNGEYYLDSCINEAVNLGLKCKVFEVDSYLCWGTPNDFRTFEYWQSCFHKWISHPYDLELDSRVDKNNLTEIKERYKADALEFVSKLI